MIKIRITNMSCGHCRLKINAELEEAGFMDNVFDMDHDTISINVSLKDISKAYRAINKAGYEIDKEFSPIITEKVTLKIADLGEKEILDKVIIILLDLGIDDIDFDLILNELYIVCDNELISLIKEKFQFGNITIL